AACGKHHHVARAEVLAGGLRGLAGFGELRGFGVDVIERLEDQLHGFGRRVDRTGFQPGAGVRHRLLETVEVGQRGTIAGPDLAARHACGGRTLHQRRCGCCDFHAHGDPRDSDYFWATAFMASPASDSDVCELLARKLIRVESAVSWVMLLMVSWPSRLRFCDSFDRSSPALSRACPQACAKACKKLVEVELFGGGELLVRLVVTSIWLFWLWLSGVVIAVLLFQLR